MTDNHELEPLLNRVLAGDGEGKEALLAKIRPYLHLLVRRQLEPDLRRKLGDSDVVQETLMRINGGLNPAAKTSAQFQGPPTPSSWPGSARSFGASSWTWTAAAKPRSEIGGEKCPAPRSLPRWPKAAHLTKPSSATRRPSCWRRL